MRWKHLFNLSLIDVYTSKKEKDMIKETFKLKNLTLKNRLVMAPVALEKSDHGTVTPELLQYYDQRTQGGYVGLVIIEHSFVRSDGRASKHQLSVANDNDLPGLTKLAKTIHQNGTLAFMQISHAGAAIKEGVVDVEGISPSAITNPNGSLGGGTFKKTHAMNQEEIDALIKAFVEAALRVKQAGFDGVEIHSAHGYLLNQFYSPLTNHRQDLYTSASIDGRIKLHLELIKAIKQAVGDDFVVGMRLGGCDYMEGGSTIADSVAASIKLQEAGLDFIDISGGMNFFIREDHQEPGYFSDQAKPVKEALSIPVILAGGVKNIDQADELLKQNVADLIGIGRAISKDDSWPNNNMQD